MSHLIVTRGIPGSGKTTRARLWVAEHPKLRCRVNRDDFRVMLHAMRRSGMRDCERAVTKAQYASIRSLLDGGYEVVSDDTWLVETRFQEIASVAAAAGATFEVWDLRDVPLDVCIERDAARGALVGSEEIIRIYRTFVAPMAR